MEQISIEELDSLFRGPLVCMLVAFARWMTFASVFAGFTWATINRGIVRNAIAIAFGLPVAIFIFNTRVDALLEMETGALSLLLIKEALLGLLLGTVASVPFWIADLSGGILAGIRQEPEGGGATTFGGTTFGQAMVLMAIGVLAYHGGFKLLLMSVYESYQFWPILDPLPNMSTKAASALLNMLALAFTQAVLVAAPFVLCWLLIDVWTGVSARMAKRLDMSAYTDVFKALITLILMIVMTGPITGLMIGVFDDYGRLSPILSVFFEDAK